MSQDKFNFFVPFTLEKGSKPGQEMRIKGIASSEVEDSDEQTLVPSGFDVSPLLSKGFLNYNHKSSESAAAIIGEPTKAEIINDGKDLYIEGFLYPDSDEAKAVYKLAQVLEKNSPNRRLGFSIEGKTLEVDPFNKKRITKAKITGIAITAMPKNPNTLLSIMKGEYSKPFVSDSDEDEEDLDKAITAEGSTSIIQKEHVEGGEKEFEKLQKEKQLTKSEAFDIILNKYSNFIKNDLLKAKEIYNLAQKINETKFNMEENKDTLSKALENAFEVIDSEINKLQKSEDTDIDNKDSKKEEESKEENEDLEKSDVQEISLDENTKQNQGDIEELQKSDEDEDEMDEDLEKAGCMYAKAKLEKGMSPELVEDQMIVKGFTPILAKSCVDKCISEMESLKENGGEVEVIQKSELDLDLIKSEIRNELQQDFEKDKVSLAKEFELRFQAIGKIIKSQTNELGELKKSLESNELLKSENENLQKSLTNLQFQVEKLLNEPVPTKSLIKSRPVERFETNQNFNSNEVYNLSKSEDVHRLTDRLSTAFDVEISKGNRNEPLASAVMELSVAKGLDRNTLNKVAPYLKTLNIDIISN